MFSRQPLDTFFHPSGPSSTSSQFAASPQHDDNTVPSFDWNTTAPALYPSSSGSIDISQVTITTTGMDFHNLFSQIIANTLQQSRGHEYLPDATEGFLYELNKFEFNKCWPKSEKLSKLHDRPIPNFYQLPFCRGLKADLLAARWIREPLSSAPPGYEKVPIFWTTKILSPSCLTFGTAIIGDGELFERAVLIQPLFPWNDQTYIEAQTEDHNTVILIRVPTEALLPGWPFAHSPHFAFLTCISPHIAGMPHAGHDVYRRCLIACYDAKAAAGHLPAPRHASPTYAMWPGYPTLLQYRDIGDWILPRVTSWAVAMENPLRVFYDFPNQPASDTTITRSTIHTKYPSATTLEPCQVELQTISSIPPEQYQTTFPDHPYNNVVVFKSVSETTDSVSEDSMESSDSEDYEDDEDTPLDPQSRSHTSTQVVGH
ncbi:hypothetical protein V5O48_015166 [Marasmius crinis-equi]|uniref:Uncharacterized protein n=1 Tax=Marasmius crinis-equi TaxID=585013 RepID=A0ABR3EV96_9AGAR